MYFKNFTSVLLLNATFQHVHNLNHGWFKLFAIVETFKQSNVIYTNVNDLGWREYYLNIGVILKVTEDAHSLTGLWMNRHRQHVHGEPGQREVLRVRSRSSSSDCGSLMRCMPAAFQAYAWKTLLQVTKGIRKHTFWFIQTSQDTCRLAQMYLKSCIIKLLHCKLLCAQCHRGSSSGKEQI